VSVALVYQGGLANVFRVGGGRPVRLLQADYHSCEMFCRGALEAGRPVRVFHADVAGDCLTAEWADGPGDLWAERKHPPTQLGV
jgi:hypothetical protein